MMKLSIAICCCTFNQAAQSGQSGREVPKSSGRYKCVPAFMQLILCKLDDVALLTDFSFVIYTNLNAEHAEHAAFRTARGNSAHNKN